MMVRAAAFGLHDGFSVPCFVGNEVTGTCSFVVGPGNPLPDGELAMAELVGHYAYEAARAMMLRARNGNATSVRLSPRQIECIELIARGKTDWEIARILGISEATVKEYVNDARRRYRVGKRVQLVLRAVFDDHLRLNDIFGERA
jgi:LuxR family quorum-sensing system transcriptional regulator CciR